MLAPAKFIVTEHMIGGMIIHGSYHSSADIPAKLPSTCLVYELRDFTPPSAGGGHAPMPSAGGGRALLPSASVGRATIPSSGGGRAPMPSAGVVVLLCLVQVAVVLV